MVTQSEFVQQGAMLLAQSGGCSVWQFRNETGDGTMTTYELFPGAVLSFNDFHMASFDSSFSARQKLFVLDYCREGRMEYLAAENALSYCKAGDLKLDRRLTESHTQAELSERFDIPLTAMKRCFRSMYGVSIGAWVTACRMDKAAQLLRQGRSAGHIVLPLVSLAALFALDWRLALAALVTFPAALVCMMLTFVISGRSFQIYDESNAAMNSAIVEYIEGIEVIKAFGRAGVSYEKYAKSITDFRTFVVKWLSSTWVTMKLAFALFPSTLIGTLPMSLWLAEKGILTTPQAALAVMLSMSMVGSLAKLEVFSENMRQVKARSVS